jgi:hypothetical protein
VRLYLEADGVGAVRLVVFNDEDEPIVFNRTMLLGPNLAGPNGPLPLSAEPGFDDPALDDVALNPGCFYGRERGWTDLPAGEYEVTGWLTGGDDLRAEPLRVRVGTDPR